MKTSIKSILKITGIPVVVASLCCLTPIVIVLFGLGSVSLAASLANTLYGTYAWVFRIAGLVLLGLSIVFGICGARKEYARWMKLRDTAMKFLILLALLLRSELLDTSFGFTSWWSMPANCCIFGHKL